MSKKNLLVWVSFSLMLVGLGIFVLSLSHPSVKSGQGGLETAKNSERGDTSTENSGHPATSGAKRRSYERACEAVANASSISEKKSALIELARTHTLTDPEGVFSLIEANLAGVDLEECLSYFFTALSLNDAITGVNFLNRLPVGTSKNNIIRLFWANSQNLSEDDIQNYFNSGLLAEEKSSFLHAIGVNKKNLNEIDHFLRDNLGDDDVKELFVNREVLGVTQNTGLKGGIELARKLLGDDHNKLARMIEEATKLAASKSGESTVEAILDARETVDPTLLNQSLAFAFNGYAQSEPLAAARKALEVSDPASRSIAVKAAIQVWINLDSVAASRWISEMPRGESRNQAIEVLVRYLERKGDAEMAEMWANQISDK